VGSSSNFKQENRLLSITTPLGEDVLLLSNLAGHEAISRLFRFNLDLVSEKKDVKFNDIIGQKVTIKIALGDNSNERYINGYVSRFAQAGTDTRFTHYQMEVVPWLWFGTRAANCRIFQNMSVPDILQKVFADLGYSSEFKNSLTGSYEPLDYCVQYRETDFNFASRLMEQYGIFYFFEHDDNSHTMVLGDSSSAHQNCPHQSSVRYAPTTKQGIEDVVTAWSFEQELRTGKYALNDYNFETPAANMLAKEQTVVEVDSNTKYEIYDYPGDYANSSDGTAVAKLRMQEEEAVNAIGSGSSSCRTLIPGYKFGLQEHDRDESNKTYVLTEVQHMASSAGSYTSGGGESTYSNHFTCIDAETPYRPTRVTPKPFVQGPQTAVVVGPSGEEIYVDKYGRVKVQFFWDREGKKDQNSSCWVRVSQPWAGKGWGGIYIPRINQEVIVSFLEGDPDRPIITGRVYNADQTVPYDLPDNGTRSTMKSSSSKGGAASKFNEVRFEDKAGDEQLFLHAQKDMDVYVVNDSRENVGNNQSIIIGQDRMESVGNDDNIKVSMNRNESVGQNQSLKIGQNDYVKTGMNYAYEAGMNVYIKGGMNVTIEATADLTLKCGGSFIALSPATVAISGPMVMINSGGAAGAGSPPQTTDPKAPDKADDGSKGGKM
jgi:type VI secretion system secreted protein VgrG